MNWSVCARDSCSPSSLSISYNLYSFPMFLSSPLFFYSLVMTTSPMTSLFILLVCLCDDALNVLSQHCCSSLLAATTPPPLLFWPVLLTSCCHVPSHYLFHPNLFLPHIPCWPHSVASSCVTCFKKTSPPFSVIPCCLSSFVDRPAWVAYMILDAFRHPAPGVELADFGTSLFASLLPPCLPCQCACLCSVHCSWCCGACVEQAVSSVLLPQNQGGCEGAEYDQVIEIVYVCSCHPVCILTVLE